MLRIIRKQCRQKRLLTAWSTGAEMAADLYRTEKETEQHKAEVAAEQHRTEKEMKPHRTDMRTEPRRADRGKNRKCGSP